MRTTTGPVHSNTPTATTQAYSPSVPLSVYRDLAAELQAAQAMLNALSAQNQQLLQENQLLRQEITKVVEPVLNLQKLVNSHTKTIYNQAPDSNSNLVREKRPVTVAPPKEQVYHPPSSVAPLAMEIPSSIPEPVFIEQEVSYYPHEAENSPIRSWWFIITILLIIVMGFGAGYLIVRPLFEHHSR